MEMLAGLQSLLTLKLTLQQDMLRGAGASGTQGTMPSPVETGRNAMNRGVYGAWETNVMTL